MDAEIFAIAERHLPRLDGGDVAVGFLEQALAASWKIEGEPRFAEFHRIEVDDVDVGKIAGRDEAAI